MRKTKPASDPQIRTQALANKAMSLLLHACRIRNKPKFWAALEALEEVSTKANGALPELRSPVVAKAMEIASS